MAYSGGQLPIMSKNPSSVTLDSIFSKHETGTSVSNTPAETGVVSLMPSFSGLSDLIQRKLQSKTIVILVGLPGSGKSTICTQLSEHLNALGYRSLIYNAGNIRRAMSSTFSDSEFFNPDNEEASRKRDSYAAMCMDNMLEDLRENRVNIGFLDATNTTKARRQLMINLIQNAGFDIPNIFILNVFCTDSRLENYNITSKAFNQDYQGKDIATSISDFKKRSEHYYRIFEPILEQEIADYKNVKQLSLGNGGKSYSVPEFFLGPHKGDSVVQMLIAFIKGYYKLHGDRYHAAVDEFYNFAFGTKD